MGTLTILSDEPNLTKDQRNLVNDAQICGEQLLVVINDILDLSMMEENKTKLESIPFSLHSAIEESLEVINIENFT